MDEITLPGITPADEVNAGTIIYGVTPDGDDVTHTLGQLLSSSSVADGIVTAGTSVLNVSTRKYTFAGWVWKIAGVLKTAATYETSAIPTETAGFNRAYIVVGKDDETFQIIAGDATEDLPIDPPTPPGTVYLTRFVSSGTVIGEPDEPIVGSDDYKKAYLLEQRITEEVLEITLPADGRTNFIFIVGAFDMEGFVIPADHEHLFAGKLFFLYNSSDDSITLKHDTGTADILFNFSDELDFVLAAKTKAIFQYSPVYGMQLVSGGVASGGLFDPAVDGVGTIVKVNQPVNSGMSVSEATGNFQGQIDGLQWKEMNLTGTVTAENYQNYTKYGAAATTFTDPTPVASGIGFTVRVVQGTAVIGGVSYGVGYIVNRLFLVSWQTRAYVDQTIIGSATQTALDLKENTSNKATDLTSPDNTKYPTTLAVQNALSAIDFEISNVLETEILENALGWAVPPSNGAYGSSYTPVRQTNVIIVQNNSSDLFFGPMIAPFETTNVAGTGGGRRRCDSLNFNSFENFVFVNDFRVDNNISNDCRYIVGLSKNYQFAFPTNNDPSVHTECIYVAKLATSNNLHIVHNDNTGTATTIDLGANFQANSNLYKYRFYLTKRSASDYDVQIFRRTLATGVVLASSIYNLTTNLPTSGGFLQQIMYINNNATPTNMRLGDYGFINKFLPL
jgi:hypothetical protein